MSSQKMLLAAVTAVVIIAVLLFVTSGSSAGKYDNFAKCLTEKGVKMYGAYWCSYCQSQKEMFQSSWKYVDYVECAIQGQKGQAEACTAAGIKGYPTWIFPNGKSVAREMTFDELSIESGCKLGSQ